MIISRKFKFIFFAVGKTGTHSIEHVLGKYDDKFILSAQEQDFFLEHIPPYYLQKKMPKDDWNKYFKFAFVRNTWDMVISDLLWNGIIHKDTEYISPGDVDRLYENQKDYRRGINWSESREQHSFLSNPDGELMVDFVGRFEDLQEDFYRICDHVGIPRETLPKLNAQKHKPYKDYYTPITIEKVRQLWQADIEKFAFEFTGSDNLSRIVEQKQ
ncbi:MAG: sulfotransferase family 2 domain-containing protein [Pseudomonadota bacterium]